MFSQYNLCGFVAMCAIGCSSALEKKTEKSIKYQSDTTRCIGLRAVSQYESTSLDRCNLSMKAKVPIVIERNKRVSFRIRRDGTLHTLPCRLNSPWIGHLERDLIAKCVDNKAWLYWVGARLNSYFSTTAILHKDGIAVEYILENGRNIDAFWSMDWSSTLEFIPKYEKDFLEKQDPRTSDEIIEDSLE